MKTLLVLLLFVSTAQSQIGRVTYIYQTTDANLLWEVENARKWKHFFIHAGDPVAAAYFAGQEAFATKQFESLGLKIPREPVNVRDE